MYRLWKNKSNQWVKIAEAITIESLTNNLPAGHYAIDCTWGSGADYFTVR